MAYYCVSLEFKQIGSWLEKRRQNDAVVLQTVKTLIALGQVYTACCGSICQKYLENNGTAKG